MFHTNRGLPRKFEKILLGFAHLGYELWGDDGPFPVSEFTLRNNLEA
jgi:hypothetical protein